VEQQLVLASVSLANTCEYCVAAHTAGLRQAGLPAEELDAFRQGRPLADPKLEALRAFTVEVVETRGRPARDALGAFRTAGHGNRQILEVILAVGMKTISNYVNHLADTPLDRELRAFAWTAGDRLQASPAS
jgi:AhpD family alkylhydroperoxidase